MKKMISLVLTVMIGIGLLAGCGSGEPDAQDSRTITDGAGRLVEVPEKVESIVCVGVGSGCHRDRQQIPGSDGG